MPAAILLYIVILQCFVYKIKGSKGSFFNILSIYAKE